ncbi:diacylglycerol kinase family lipid kinase [Streptococcus panodentis]|uniref:Diacylglycerol kinase n=1 Tax=Streptococcus panodentis TaxID=1581472 RepID=A0ABS5AYY5_9STRE|nr:MULTISPECIES: diacylglycerol kinase family lipid kinase [Streptococcus]KXT83997.1 Transcription regulator [Streptococcus sp. DD11]MBP2621788.1 diacylglycerol kinase [Streptococcus panodentis]
MKDKTKRARLIYNPTSGQEIIKRNIAEVLDVLEDVGYETSAYQTTPEPLSAQKEAERAARAGFDLIIAAGGDGTINEVVNGVAGLESRPKLAFIPTGTTNDYARALKIPMGDPVAAARIIEKNQTIKMDIGRAYGSKYFINIAAAGTLTELTYSVPSEVKSRLGYFAYVAEGAKILPRSKFRKVRIEHDHGVFEGKISLMFAALTNSIAGFEQLAPDAKLDDGNFTLILVKTANLFDMLGLMMQAINGGQHVGDVNVEYLKTSRLKLEILDKKEPFMLNLDGEYGGDTPVELEVLGNHLEFFANIDEINENALSIE